MPLLKQCKNQKIDFAIIDVLRHCSFFHGEKYRSLEEGASCPKLNASSESYCKSIL